MIMRKLHFDIDLEEVQQISALDEKANNKQHQGHVSESTTQNIIDAVKNKAKYSSDADAMVMIAALCQMGGTNRGGLHQITFTYRGVRMSGLELNLLIKEAGKGVTARQFAKTHATVIHSIAEALNIPGDLAKKRELDVARQTQEQAVWCSNFQTKNPDCDKEVRQWLLNNYKSRFSS